MLAGERHRTILALLRAQGGTDNRQLSRALGVSETTVRRDLAALHERGALRRVSGGAVPVAADAGAQVTRAPVRVPVPARGIAGAAAALVPPDATVAVSGGAHMADLGRALTAVADLTVVTTCTAVAAALRGAPHREHIVVGGISTRGGQVGPLALDTIRSLHVDLLFLAAHGIDPGGQFTAADLPQAETGQALIAAARQVVVLADHTTWAREGAAPLALLARADVVVSDDALPPPARTLLATHTGRLILTPAYANARPPARALTA